jgi:transcriptional regulator with XRE-family HTH domain
MTDDSMRLNLVQIRRGLGMKARELSALIGSDHTTISRVEHCKAHRPGTYMLYWLLKQYGVNGINTALDYWLYHKLKHQLQADILDRLAVRYKGQYYCAWHRGMQLVHPEYFKPKELKRAA